MAETGSWIGTESGFRSGFADTLSLHHPLWLAAHQANGLPPSLQRRSWTQDGGSWCCWRSRTLEEETRQAEHGGQRELRAGSERSHSGCGALPRSLAFFPTGQLPLSSTAATTLHLPKAQCKSGALCVEGLTGDYCKARIMVTLFAEPRWKIRAGRGFIFPPSS